MLKFGVAKTYESIVAPLTNVLNQLEALAEANSVTASANAVRIAELTAENARIEAENDKINTTADKIAALFA